MPTPKDRSLPRFHADGLTRLREVTRAYGSAITAFSAGIDSTLVALVARQELGDRALAVTAHSESLAPSELEDALALADELGLRHRVVRTDELSDPRYASNPVDRCYFCKSHLYEQLIVIADQVGARHVLNGLNLDDRGDWRPGAAAAAELGGRVRSPLLEAELGKEAIRAIARHLGIRSWDKPALACLSSRVPYGQPVTAEKLARIARAEAALHELGFRQLRVRHFEDHARVEIAPAELPRIEQEADLRTKVVAGLVELGFSRVEIDPRGYRSGSLNEGVVPVGELVTSR